MPTKTHRFIAGEVTEVRKGKSGTTFTFGTSHLFVRNALLERHFDGLGPGDEAIVTFQSERSEGRVTYAKKVYGVIHPVNTYKVLCFLDWIGNDHERAKEVLECFSGDNKLD